MQNIRKPVLDGTRALLPVGCTLNPVGPMRNIGPCPNVRYARHQRVDVAIEAFEALYMAVNPVLGQAFAALRQMPEKLAQQLYVFFRHRLAEVRDLTHLP